MPEAFERIARLARASSTCTSRSTAGSAQDERRAAVREAGRRRCSSPGRADLRATRISPRAYRAARSPAAGMSLERALELAGARRAASPIRTRPSARSSSRDGAVVGEGVTERSGGPARRGRRARRGGRAGARRDALRDDGAVRPPRHARRRASTPCSPPGIARVVAGSARPEPRGGRRARAAARRPASRPSSSTASRRGARTRPGAPGSRCGRPFVTYKVGDHARRPRHGARPRAGSRARSRRRRVHELRAGVGRGRRRDGDRARRRARGSTRATSTRARQPRRLAFGRGPLPPGRSSSCAPAPLADELARARRRGRPVAPARGRPDARRRVPRGRTSSTSCSLFVAPALSGDGPRVPRRALDEPVRLTRADESGGRRGRSPRGVPSRAVVSDYVHRTRAGGWTVASFEGRRRLASLSSRRGQPRSATRLRSTVSA